MRYCFDLDGTLFETDGMDYANAQPITDRIEHVKRLIADGHSVVFYTARGWGAKNIRPELARARKQLAAAGIEDPKVYPKPPAEVYVDDRATNSEQYFAGELMGKVQAAMDAAYATPQPFMATNGDSP